MVSMAFGDVYRGRRVLVTGHTGFKGSWLVEWLLGLGAKVSGCSLSPAHPSLFDQLRLAPRIHHHVVDIRDASAIQALVAQEKPDFVFHLAAQPLVRLSYQQPVETYATNVMGTVNILEAVRMAQLPCVVIAVTTDKCYENREWLYGYCEEDALGGYDPYSSSKAAAELVIAAYRRSFFSQSSTANPQLPLIRLASARAGNVIGGGDFAHDRIVPDCVRSLMQNEAIPVRNKISTRPWQHVLEPLSGYLWLAACLAHPQLSSLNSPSAALISQLAGPFNFGPGLSSNRTVAELVQEVVKHWPGRWEDKSDPDAVHEAKLLNLATDKAHHLLHWKPVWNFEETVAETIQWYREASSDTALFTRRQISDYSSAARSAGLRWAT
jgi:CDP-glucose 4,6-dehydratase